MEPPRIAIKENGDLHVSRLAEPFAVILLELPELFKKASADPRVKTRLFPDAYDDLEANDEWRKHVTPETEHLFQSATTLVCNDLKTLAREPLRRSFKLTIRKTSLRAWVTSLNAARLSLGAIHRVTEEDMERDSDFDPASERDAALLRIRLLGWIEELLVEVYGDLA